MLSRSADWSQSDEKPRNGSMNNPFDLNKQISTGFKPNKTKRSRSAKSVNHSKPKSTHDHNTSISAWWASCMPAGIPLQREAKVVAKEPTRTPGVSKCVSCLDRVQRQDSLRLNCGHVWCIECLNTHFRRLSEERNSSPPRCCWKGTINVAAIAYVLADDVWNGYALMKQKQNGYQPNSSKKRIEQSVSIAATRKGGSTASGTTLCGSSASGASGENTLCAHREFFRTTTCASDTFKQCPGCGELIEPPRAGSHLMDCEEITDDFVNYWLYDWGSAKTYESDDESCYSQPEHEDQSQLTKVKTNESRLSIAAALKEIPPIPHFHSFLNLSSTSTLAPFEDFDSDPPRGRSPTPVTLNIHTQQPEWEGDFAHAICASWNAREVSGMNSPTVNIKLHDWTSDEEPVQKKGKAVILRRTFNKAVGSVRRYYRPERPVQ